MKQSSYIGIVGFGNMGAALGIAMSNSKAMTVCTYDIDKKKSKNKKIKTHVNLNDLLNDCKTIILAIKPQSIKRFLTDNKELITKNKPLIITIAAGIPTTLFQKQIKNLRVVRVMPNLPAKIGEAVSFIAKGKNATATDLALTKKIFSLVGETFITKEITLDKVTSITGSGPGYVYYFMDCLYKSAVDLGFNKADAKKMVTQTFLGAAKLAKSSNENFDILISSVASKGGTTQAALSIFKENKQSKVIDMAVKAALKRANQISKQYIGD